MKIKILYLYPDLMNLYGSSGNIRCLERHIVAAGGETEVVRATVYDEIDESIEYKYLYEHVHQNYMMKLTELD